MNFHINIQASPPNRLAFETKVSNLMQHSLANYNLLFPPRLSARRIYENLKNNRPKTRVRMTTRRHLLRYFVSMHAQTILITDGSVISRVTDMLMEMATRQEILQYHVLANQVNSIIRRNR
ncbi:hypothetical protein C1645_872938 [Glomus cerebriforme]|uniref:Uncharacterized protein n=1 Tax=Glomus cerebriforme TaxID=658196 RepID=A0A397TJY8_9GLOM|nr:hypothetical protein C1645_872938 [Glomus cerebriforme]